MRFVFKDLGYENEITIENDELTGIDDNIFEVSSDFLRLVLEEHLCFPILQMRLFLDDYPMIGVQIDNFFADSDLGEDWTFFCIYVLDC